MFLVVVIMEDEEVAIFFEGLLVLISTLLVCEKVRLRF
jgi:hypothetical protein